MINILTYVKNVQIEVVRMFKWLINISCIIIIFLSNKLHLNKRINILMKA